MNVVGERSKVTNKSPKCKVNLCSFSYPDHPDLKVSTGKSYPNIRPTYSENSAYAYKGIYFFVQRKDSFDEKDNVITYNVERLNIGKGMNAKSGVFTAPKAGIYYFSMFGIKQHAKDDPFILIRVNQQNVALTYSFSREWTSLATAATVQLNQGDQVDLYKEGLD